MSSMPRKELQGALKSHEQRMDERSTTKMKGDVTLQAQLEK